MQVLIWLTLTVAGYIVWQDFKYRYVSILSFVLIFVLLMARGVMIYSFHENLNFFLINACFITFQLIFLTLYLTLKNKRVVLITRNHLGAGDIVMLYVICLLAEPIIFILFYLFILIMSLIYSFAFKVAGTYHKDDNKKEFSIPLAGIFSLATGMYLIFFDLWNYDPFVLLSVLNKLRIL
ncbi:MAG: hypothetical protein A3H98_11945 [Bacteroidetes bacterium RIFCSPLOWO2_02_FULL_36_8]|nr:MAG: hypothetical protein A3H98_11945 [Bacteroidetes bacterium RIFCSPLOWO2_02_FULL_36_8]OFY69573.1 MAG: hypothetical protein A3G23_11085 [Bacteroidetes bacterium RIFCSPLOWO2_12_FULL_37_12]